MEQTNNKGVCGGQHLTGSNQVHDGNSCSCHHSECEGTRQPEHPENKHQHRTDDMTTHAGNTCRCHFANRKKKILTRDMQLFPKNLQKMVSIPLAQNNLAPYINMHQIKAEDCEFASFNVDFPWMDASPGEQKHICEGA